MNSEQTSPNSTLPSDSASKPKTTTFLCEYQDCLKAFKAKKSLIDHTRIHKGEKPYSCHFNPCSKAFTQYSSLQKHERIHKGEKPYNCETCGQAFTQVSNLKRHERSHRGERPYSCDVCSKGFTTSSNLKQHYQTHLQKDTRDKYECESCGKAYNYNSSLKKHLQEHGMDSTKKEANIVCEYNPINNREFHSHTDQFSLPLMENSNKSTAFGNLYNNFPLNSFQHSSINNLDFYPSFPPNLMFQDFFQSPFRIRPTTTVNENISLKKSSEGVVEKAENKPSTSISHTHAFTHAHPHLHTHSYTHTHSHGHTHSLICEHLMIIHQGHVDYLHDGKLHHVTSTGMLEEHELELSETNPAKCKSLEKIKSQELIYFPHKKNNLLPSQAYNLNSEQPNLSSTCKEDVCSLSKHVHSEGCEHPMIIHNGHIDYIVEGQLHHVHDGHCDNHGQVYIVDKFMEIQKTNNFYGGGNFDSGIQGEEEKGTNF